MENVMKRLLSIIACWGILLASPQQSNAADLSGLVPSLKAGGYVIVSTRCYR
jgi:hypothetical protein